MTTHLNSSYFSKMPLSTVLDPYSLHTNYTKGYQWRQKWVH